MQALVTDIVPDGKVRAAMNDINASQRLRCASCAPCTRQALPPPTTSPTAYILMCYLHTLRLAHFSAPLLPARPSHLVWEPPIRSYCFLHFLQSSSCGEGGGAEDPGGEGGGGGR